MLELILKYFKCRARGLDYKSILMKPSFLKFYPKHFFNVRSSIIKFHVIQSNVYLVQHLHDRSTIGSTKESVKFLSDGPAGKIGWYVLIYSNARY